MERVVSPSRLQSSRPLVGLAVAGPLENGVLDADLAEVLSVFVDQGERWV